MRTLTLNSEPINFLEEVKSVMGVATVLNVVFVDIFFKIKSG